MLVECQKTCFVDSSLVAHKSEKRSVKRIGGASLAKAIWQGWRTGTLRVPLAAWVPGAAAREVKRDSRSTIMKPES